MNKKIVCITGAAKGIGAKTAEAFASEGYEIILHYNANKLLAEQLKIYLEEKYNTQVYLIQADLSNEDDVDNFINFVKNNTNKLDVLINNASLSLDCEILSKTKEEFIKVLDVNLVAPFLLIKSLYNLLDNGVIINISSTDGIDTGNIYNIDYSASKAGLNCLTKIISGQFDNIRIYALAPNWVKTESILEMNPIFLQEELNRIGQKRLILPEEVATKILNILNDESIPSGSIIRMDGNNE